MEEEHIDPIGAESLQAGFDGAHEMEARRTAPVGTCPGREIGLGRHDHFVATGRDQLSEDLLGPPSVELFGEAVEEGHPPLRVHHDERVGRLLDEFAEVPVARPHLPEVTTGAPAGWEAGGG